MMRKERTNCMVKLKLIMGKLKTHLQLIPKSIIRHETHEAVREFVETPRANDEVVPNDVKEGHFAVFTVNPEEEPKRFVVELHWLANPSFLNLLKQAEDEYGFVQKGVLEIPCRAEELQQILQLKTGRNITSFAV
ncbi:PREDICTED: auxin-responsive protein SAUR32-like [Nicotiana attenuata]|uniref:Auxin-responsive protein saur32 n=1 Tax=Nicotiana attenuata TaxID=49451 RepID=A0A1J6I015_NICAT|nr:PREDICTED: auxin-responsive protein SAUR32-like [Nicotiana attenuata]OIS97913.1 auxin-responsive protein saur32 [Nicotiana attenuata]